MIGFATPWNGKTTIVRFRQNEEPWQSMNCTSITIEGSLLRIGTARELPSCCQPTLIKFFRPFRHTSALSGTLLCDISRAIAFPVNISVNNSNDLGGILASAKNCLQRHKTDVTDIAKIEADEPSEYTFLFLQQI
jgi:hypothetical protein